MGPALAPLPDRFSASVASLHRVAEELVAPARKPDNEIALTATPGGFGTPRFVWEGSRHQVRVEADQLVHIVGDKARQAPLDSLASAAVVVADLLPSTAGLDETPLEIDPQASRALAGWYGFGADVLGYLVAVAGAEDEPTPPILWPEHFDIAIELGSEEHGARANYGLSPGDESHHEPYLYVGPWTAHVSGELWGASGFNGAELGYAELLAAGDQRGTAIEFFEARRVALADLENTDGGER
jgi:hypothetical protein